MANICTTDVIIYGDSDLIYDLVKSYKTVEERSKHKYSISIKDFCEEIGVSTEGEDCRANIEFFEYDNKGYSSITMLIDSAWTPPHFFLAALDDTEKFPNIGVSFMAEELGCGIYETNDMDYFSEYRFYVYSESCDSEYFSCQKDADEYIKENNLIEDEYSIYELEEVDINGNS